MDLVDRRTGKLVDVPDQAVAAAFKSGLYGLPKGASLPVGLPGITGTVDAKDASAALDTGMNVPKESTFRAAQDEQRFGGVGGGALAAGAGLLRGAGEVVGLPTDATALGLANTFGQFQRENDPYHGERIVSPEDRLRAGLTGLERTHPYASQGGELAGLVAGSVLTGGGGLAAAGDLGTALAPKALGRLGAGAARGAFEGGYLGAVGAVNESALGDAPLNGEKLVAGIGHGALLGAGLGAGFSGLGLLKDQIRDSTGRYLSRLAPADVTALAEKTFGYAPEGIGEKVQRAYAKVSAGVSGKNPETIAKLTEFSPEGAEARRIAVYDAPKIQDEAERSIRAFGDGMLKESQAVSDLARGELKKEFLERAVLAGNEAEVRKSASEAVQKILTGAEAELTHADGVAKPSIRAIESTSRAAYRVVSALEQGAANHVVYAELDTLKRAMQDYSSQGTKGIQAIADPLDRINARRSLQWLKEQADDVRGLLENRDLFGKAADAQRDVNAAWTKQIEAKRRFNQALTTDVGRDAADPYARQIGLDPQKVHSYVRGLTNPYQDLTHQAVKDYAASTRELVDAVKKHYDLSPEKLKAVDTVHASAKGFEAELGKAEKALVTANQFRALTEGTTDSLSALLGTVGGLVGGIPGGALGAAAGAVANPGRVVAQLAAVERLMSKVDTRMGSSLRDFFRGRSRGTTAALHEAASPEGFDKTTKLIAETVGPDGNVTQAGAARIAESLGDLGHSAPKIADAAMATAIKTAQFLFAKIPPGMRDPHDMFPGDTPPLVSETERETWARYFAAANDPSSVVAHFAHGTITPEESETLKACYPAIYDKLHGKALELVTQAAAKGKPLDYQQKVTWGVLFEARTDATLGGDVMQAVAAARAKKRGGGGAAAQGMHMLRPMPHMSGRFQTTFEASSSRRKGGL